MAESPSPSFPLPVPALQWAPPFLLQSRPHTPHWALHSVQSPVVLLYLFSLLQNTPQVVFRLRREDILAFSLFSLFSLSWNFFQQNMFQAFFLLWDCMDICGPMWRLDWTCQTLLAWVFATSLTCCSTVAYTSWMASQYFCTASCRDTLRAAHTSLLTSMQGWGQVLSGFIVNAGTGVWKKWLWGMVVNPCSAKCQTRWWEARWWILY